MAMFDRKQLYTEQGVPKTREIFCELNAANGILSIQNEDAPVPSLRKLYVSLTVEDPSEATFVEVVFGDFHYWERLKNSPLMQEHLPAWRHEAAVKRKSEAFKYMVNEIRNDGKNAYGAAKYLIDAPWEPKTRASREANKKSSAEAAPADVIDFIKARNK